MLGYIDINIHQPCGVSIFGDTKVGPSFKGQEPITLFLCRYRLHPERLCLTSCKKAAPNDIIGLQAPSFQQRLQVIWGHQPIERGHHQIRHPVLQDLHDGSVGHRTWHKRLAGAE